MIDDHYTPRPYSAMAMVLCFLCWAGGSQTAYAQPGPIPGGQPYPDNVYLSPPPQTQADAATMHLTTRDGRTVTGMITSGLITVKTAFGTRDIDAIHIQSLNDQMLALDDGFTHSGTVTILKGSVQFRTTEELLNVPASSIHALRGTLTVGALPQSSGGQASSSDEPATDVHRIIVGKWFDSQSTNWEFFKDGTFLMRQQLTGHYTFVDSRHLKIDIWMFGMQMAQVYEVAELNHDLIVLKQQSSQLTLKRVQ